MATINRDSEKQNFRQIEGDSWSNLYLPAISAGAVLAVVLFMAVSCSKKSDNQGAGVSAPSQPVVEIPAAAVAPPLPQLPKKAVKKHRPTVATYVNDAYGVSFSYPRKYSLAAGSKQREMPVETGFVKPGVVEIASVDMPDGGYPDTDFSSALLNLSVNPGLGREDCAQFAGTPDASAKIDGQSGPKPAEPSDAADATAVGPAQTPQPTPVKLGSNEFTETEQVKQAGDRESDVKYFHVFRNDACYEFALDIETSRKADQDLAQVDRGQVFKQLAKILTTAKIKETELPGMAKAERPDASAPLQPAPSGGPATIAEPPAGADSPSSAQPNEKSQVVPPERN